jgi:hypothetical protein
MKNDHIKEEILRKIKEIAEESGGKAPGADKFYAETGIRPHVWRGKIWRIWSDAVAEAGYAPNVLQRAYTDEQLLRPVLEIAKELDRFPTTGDISFEMNQRSDFPNPDTVFFRWKMLELANVLGKYAQEHDEPAL